jgi:hypothetical protein
LIRTLIFKPFANSSMLNLLLSSVRPWNCMVIPTMFCLLRCLGYPKVLYRPLRKPLDAPIAPMETNCFLFILGTTAPSTLHLIVCLYGLSITRLFLALLKEVNHPNPCKPILHIGRQHLQYPVPLLRHFLLNLQNQHHTVVP